MKNAIEFYDKTASWSDEYFMEEKNTEVAKKFADCYFSAGTVCPRILDIGCGVGYDAKTLTELGAKVVGIDLSQKQIQLAKNHVLGAKFFVGDISDNLTSLGKFDGIMCLATIMHVNATNMRTVLQNMCKALKKGGLILISAFDGEGKNYEKSMASIDGETYDKNFNNYSAAELCNYAYPFLKLVDTWQMSDFEEGWRYYVFTKV